MSLNSIHVINWRRRTKTRIIESFGGMCGICGYNKCQRSIDLHHLDPSQKEFSLGKIRAHPKSWSSVVEELKKCVLLCKNCHGEVHDNITQIPDDIKRFNESFSDYKKINDVDKNSKLLKDCPVCKKETSVSNKTCSLVCSGKLRERVRWDQVDLYDLMINKKQTLVKISELLGCSHAAVWKRVKKLKSKNLL